MATYVPRPQVSLTVTPHTPVEFFDRPHPETGGRVVGVRIGGATTVQFSDWDDGDAEILAATGALIDALMEIRKGAQARIAEDAQGWVIAGGYAPALPDIPLAAMDALELRALNGDR